MSVEIKEDNLRLAYRTGCPDVKNTLQKLFPTFDFTKGVTFDLSKLKPRPPGSDVWDGFTQASCVEAGFDHATQLMWVDPRRNRFYINSDYPVELKSDPTGQWIEFKGYRHGS